MPEGLDGDGLRLGARLLLEETAETLLEQLVQLSVEALETLEAAGLTLRRGGTEETVNASSEVAWGLDQAQYDSGRGPCVTAARTGEQVVVDIQAGDPRWPEFADAALARGLGTSVSMPLLVGGEPTGAFNTYGRG